MPRRQPNIIFILMLVAFAHMIVTSFAQEDDGAGDPPLREFIWSVTWSPDGSKIAVGMGPESCNQENNDYSVRLIEPVTLTISDKLNFHTCSANSLEWSGNSQDLISSGGGQGETVLWDMATGEPRLSVRSQTAPHRIYDSVWSPSNAEFATIYWGDSHIAFWNAADGALLSTLDISTLDPNTYSEPTSLVWSPDGQEIAVGTDTGKLMILDYATGVPRVIVNGHVSVISSIQWKDNQIATASWDNNIRIWNSDTGNLELTLIGHTDFVQQIVWQEDINTIASASNDGTVRVWNPLDGTQIGMLSYPGKVWAVDWSPDGSQLAYGGIRSDEQDAEIVIANAPVTLTAQSQELIGTAFVNWSPDGSMIAKGFADQIQIIDAETLTVLNSISDLNRQVIEPVWSADSRLLAFKNNPDVIVLEHPWDSDNVQQIAAFTDLRDVDGLSFSPDGLNLAIAIDFTVFIGEIATSSQIAEFSDEGDRWGLVRDVKWNGDNRLALTTSSNLTALLDPDTGQPTHYFHIFNPENYYGRVIEFSPDGNKMAVANEWGEIYICGDTHTDELMTESPELRMRHDGDVTDISWNTLGHLLASAGGDGNINIWDVTDGSLVDTIQVTTQTEVNSAEWSPDGKRLAYGTDDGDLVIIPAPNIATTPTPTP